jgi:hypothetical protein
MIGLRALLSNKPEIKYHCAKRAIALSEKNPKALYPQLNVFVKLLDGDNNVLKWVSIIVIGNLAGADKQNKISKLIPRLIGLLHGKSMITANNTIVALGKIAKHKPQFKEKIFRALLDVEKATYYNKGKVSPECRNIALGKVIGVLAEHSDELKDNKKAITFLQRQTKNTRSATRERAKKAIDKLK